MNRPLVVGVGNPDRGDDAAGPLVAARVAALGLPGIDVVEQAEPVGLLTHLLDRDGDRDVVVVVDAVAPAGRPGRLHVCALEQRGVAARSGGTGGSHGLDVADMVALARALGRGPRSVVLVGIEGASFEPGHLMPAPVSAALPAAASAAIAAADAAQSQGIRTLRQ